MSIHSLFIINDKGKILFDKYYRGLESRTICDPFIDELIKAESGDIPQVIESSKHYLINIKTDSLYFVGITSYDTDVLMVIEFLNRISETFKLYFGKDPLTEQTFRDNFLTIYEIIDEIGDYGQPFNTEPNTLMELVSPPTILSKIQSKVMGTGQSVQNVLPEHVTGNIYWRKNNIKHTRNEIYLDIIERIQCTIERGGAVTNSEIIGEIQCKSHLSGKPDILLRLSNPLMFDDVSFHQCVRYTRWEKEKVLSFVPPDGDFKLMDFRITGNVTLPFIIFPQIIYSDTGAKVLVKFGPKTNVAQKPIENIVITIPFSKQTSSSTLSANVGVVNFDDKTKVCTWTIDSIPQNVNPVLEGSVSQPPGSYKPEVNPTILIDFNIVAWSVSGLKVDSLTVYGEKYEAHKGARNITKGASIQVRS